MSILQASCFLVMVLLNWIFVLYPMRMRNSQMTLSPSVTVSQMQQKEYPWVSNLHRRCQRCPPQSGQRISWTSSADVRSLHRNTLLLFCGMYWFTLTVIRSMPSSRIVSTSFEKRGLLPSSFPLLSKSRGNGISQSHRRTRSVGAMWKKL